MLGIEFHGVTVHMTESQGLELASEVTPRQIGEMTPVITNQTSDDHWMIDLWNDNP